MNKSVNFWTGLWGKTNKKPQSFTGKTERTYSNIAHASFPLPPPPPPPPPPHFPALTHKYLSASDDALSCVCVCACARAHFPIIIMDICKAPTLRLKALNKHTHIMYIEIYIPIYIPMSYCPAHPLFIDIFKQCSQAIYSFTVLRHLIHRKRVAFQQGLGVGVGWSISLRLLRPFALSLQWEFGLCVNIWRGGGGGGGF